MSGKIVVEDRRDCPCADCEAKRAGFVDASGLRKAGEMEWLVVAGIFAAIPICLLALCFQVAK